MERSWDVLLKTPQGMIIAIACALLVLIFIVGGGIVMRLEIHRQRAARDQVKKSEDVPIP